MIHTTRLWSLPSALFVSILGCSPAAPPQSAVQEPAPEEPTPAEPTAPDAATSPPSTTQAVAVEQTPALTRVETELGENVVATIRSATTVSVAKLRTDAALRLRDEQKTLQDDGYIDYFPIKGKLRQLQPDEAARLGALLLADESHVFDVRRRCADKRWVGARFEKATGERVEVALGTPCNHLGVASRREGVVQHWGSLLTDEAAASVTAIVEAAPAASQAP